MLIELNGRCGHSLRPQGYSNLEANTPKATLADQVNYWSNYPKFFVSLMKSFYGDAAQKENNWGYDWLPKWDQTYDVIKYFNMMDEGKVTGYFCQGFSPCFLPAVHTRSSLPDTLLSATVSETNTTVVARYPPTIASTRYSPGSCWPRGI